MAIIDSQVHVYEANTPTRPWHSVPNWPEHVTGDEMVAAMDKVGVDGAILISAFSMYRYDASYAVEVQRAHPGRFALIRPVDPDNPAVADVVADWKKTPGTVGIRIMMPKEAGRDPNDPGIDRILRGVVDRDGADLVGERQPVGVPVHDPHPAGALEDGGWCGPRFEIAEPVATQRRISHRGGAADRRGHAAAPAAGVRPAR